MSIFELATARSMHRHVPVVFYLGSWGKIEEEIG